MAQTQSRLRKTFRWVAVAVLAVSGLVVLLLFLLTLPPGERFLKGILESQLEASLYQQVTIGNLETNLLSRLVLTDLSVHDRDSSSAHPIVRLRRLSLRYDLRRLLHGELRVRSAIIDSVFLTVTRDAHGRSDLTVVDSLDIILADTTALPIAITIDTVILNDLDLDLRDDAEGLQAGIRDARVHFVRDGDDGFRFSLNIPSVSAVYDSIPVAMASLSILGTWRDERLRIERLEASSAGLTIQGEGSYALRDSVLDGRIVIAGNPDSLIGPVAMRRGWGPIVTEGEMRCVIEALGTPSRPQVQLALDLPPIRTGTFHTGISHVAARLENDTVSIDSAMIRAFDGIVGVRGTIAVDTSMWSDLRLRIRSIGLGQFLELAIEEPLSVAGQVDGELTLSGPLTEPSQLDFISDWRVRNPRWEGRVLPGFSIRASLNDGLAKIDIDGAGITAEAACRLRGDQIEGDYRVHLPDLGVVARFADVEGITGALSIDGTVEGNQKQPAVRATIAGERIRYRNLPLDSLHAEARFVGGSVYIDTLAFTGDWEGSDSSDTLFGLSGIAGSFSLHGGAVGPLAEIDGEMEISARELGKDTGPRVSGLALARISGGRSVHLKSRMTVDSLELGIEGRYDFVDSSVSLSLVVPQSPSDDERQLEPDLPETWHGEDSLAGAVAWLTIDAVGIGSDDPAVAFEGTVNNLSDLVAQWSDTLNVGGTLAIAGQAGGSLEEPHLGFAMRMHDVRYLDWALDSLFARVALDWETVRCDSLEAYVSGARAFASAVIPIHVDTLGDYSIDMSRTGCGRIRVPAFDLALTRPALPSGATLSGRLEADLEWEGPLRAPSARGWASVTGASFLRSPESHPVENIRGRISFADSSVTLDSLRGELRGFPFDISGRAAIAGPGNLSGEMGCDLAQLGTAQVQGSVSTDSVSIFARTQALRLAVLSPFVPAIRGLKGSVDTEIRVTGSRESPNANGRLTISDLVLCHPRLDSCLSDGRVVLTFSGYRTQLDTLFLRYGAGAITASGYAIHSGLTPSEVDLSLQAENLRYQRPKYAKVTVDSALLRFRQTSDGSVVEGDISMGESRLLARIKPQTLAPWARTVERAGPAVPPMFEDTRLDIRLRQSDSLWIDNNLARIRLAAALSVSGGIAQPVVAGRIGVEEGHLLYLDRRFSVKEGALLFADPEKINPDIILLAETRVTSYSGMLAAPYVITIAIEGTAEDLTVDLYSDPPADYADILSLLTVGATRTQLSGNGDTGERGAKDILLARGAELAGQRVTGFMTRRVGSRLGLDEVSVEGNILTPEGRQDARLLASRRLTERLKLSYSTAVGHLNDQAVRLNYRLTRRFSLEGQTTQQGKSVLGIEYSLPIK